jgi:dihydroneopterin triphosphate diphosphatase
VPSSASSETGPGFKIPESVLVVIHTPVGEVLLLERADYAGFWQSVTGSRDTPEEAFLQTAIREVFEETGMKCEAGCFRDWAVSNVYEIYPNWRKRYAPGVTHNTEHVFSLCVPRDSVITPSPREHTAFKWLPWLAAADDCFSPSNAEAILMLPRFAPEVSG